MSQENVEIVRAVFEAWNAGEMDPGFGFGFGWGLDSPVRSTDLSCLTSIA